MFSKAATARSVEPSKNVRATRFRAERSALLRGKAGKLTQAMLSRCAYHILSEPFFVCKY